MKYTIETTDNGCIETLEMSKKREIPEKINKNRIWLQIFRF